MFDTWLHGKKRRETSSRQHTPRNYRPALEPLEDRTVPSAIRNLPGFLTNALPPEDDSPSPQANVGFNMNFFGLQSSQVFVNNNGNITFGRAFPTFTPSALNTANGGVPIIAPFFADVDTRGTGNVVTYGTDTLCGHLAFGVDYINVNYFSATSAGHPDRFDSFQLILIDRSDTGPGNFDIEFNYNQIQWETGDASGGTNGLGGSSAHVGYTNGSGTQGTFAELPGSGSNGAFLDSGPNALSSHSLQASTPGRFHFFVRNGQVTETLTASAAVDVTSSVRRFNPFRYLFRQGVFSGRFLFQRTGGALQQQINNACLDESATNNVVGFGPPITLVFDHLPRNVTLANPTGFTASGSAFLTIPNQFAKVGDRFRVVLRFHNPSGVPLSTFYQGFSIRVFAGPFDSSVV